MKAALILALVCAAQFVVILDLAIVNVALPSIQAGSMMRGSVEVDGGVVEVGEEGDAFTEEHGHQADHELVEEPGVEALLGDVGDGDRDHLVAGDGLGLGEGALDAVGDERERGVVAGPAVGDGVGDHEDWCAHRMGAAPSAGDVEQAAAITRWTGQEWLITRSRASSELAS